MRSKTFFPLNVVFDSDLGRHSVINHVKAAEYLKKEGLTGCGCVNHFNSRSWIETSFFFKKKPYKIVYGTRVHVDYLNEQIPVFIYPKSREGHYRCAAMFTKRNSLEDLYVVGECFLIVDVGALNTSVTSTLMEEPLFARDDFYLGVGEDFLDYEHEKFSLLMNNPYKLVAFPEIRHLEEPLALQVFGAIRENTRLKREAGTAPVDYCSVFAPLPTALLNSVLIARDISLSFDKQEGTTFYEHPTQEEFLRVVFWRMGGLLRILPAGERDRYVQQTIYESRVVLFKKLHEYFLIVYHLVRECKARGMVIGPRGSAAGALISYLLDITEIDPIKFGLFFERFISVDRPDYPDYDLDFSPASREEVLYIFNEQWKHKFTMLHIMSWSTMKAKNTIKGVAKVFGKTEFEQEQFGGYIRNIVTKRRSLVDFYEEEEGLRTVVEASPENREIYELSLSLEGLKLHRSVHPAGIVLVPHDSVDYLGTSDSDTSTPICEQSMETLEKLGLIKFDILGLDALGTIQQAMEHRGTRLADIPMDDPIAFREIKHCATQGLFQLTYLNSEIAKQVSAASVEDIAEIIGINRPGSMDFIDDYVAKKQSGAVSSSGTEADEVAKITAPTAGIIIWQEQVMRLSVLIAGYTNVEANNLRRLIGKKKLEAIAAERVKFLGKAVPRVGQTKADYYWNLIAKFGGYGFNKAHGVAYAHNTYYMAWFKAHDRKLYYGSLIDFEHDKDRIANDLQCAQWEGVELSMPPVREFKQKCTVTAEALVMGWDSVPGISKAVVTKVQSAGAHVLSDNEWARMARGGWTRDLEWSPSGWEQEFHALGFVLSDSKGKVGSRSCLAEMVFNHTFYAGKEWTIRGARFLKVTRRKMDFKDRINTRMWEQPSSVLVDISDGSYTIKCLVEGHIYDKFNRFYRIGQPLVCSFVLGKSIKNLLLIDINDYQ